MLAVGDAEFQKKCLGKMHDVADQGRTVLFVSHNTAAISSLTKRCAYLRGGKLVKLGPTPEAIDDYISGGNTGVVEYVKPNRLIKQHSPFIRKLLLKTSSGSDKHELGYPLTIFIEFAFPCPTKNACFSIHILDMYGRSVIHAHTYSPDYCSASEPVTRHWPVTFQVLN